MFHNYVELVIQLTHSLYRRCNSVPVLRWCHQHVSVRLTASPLNAEPHGVWKTTQKRSHNKCIWV